MGHIVLLGDSIFDNEAYVEDRPSVIDQLKRLLPDDWTATLLAQDGAVAAAVVRQLNALPSDATHLIVSAGGNNALQQNAGLLDEPAESFNDVLTVLGDILNNFQIEYHAMLQAAVATQRPVIACTIYDSIPVLDRAARAGLRLYNDVIIREAIRTRIPVIDLRTVCTESADYAPISPIEPSVFGGEKITRAIWHAVQNIDPAEKYCRVFSSDGVSHNHEDRVEL